MSTVSLTLDEIHQLAVDVFSNNGCDEANTNALASTVMRAERDGSTSHGLFRVPGYIAGLRSGKVNGKADPQAEMVTPAVIRMHGDNGYAPLAIERGTKLLAKAASEIGIAAMAIIRTHHFAALWPETEALAEQGVVGIACTAYKPSVAPAGGSQPMFGTNPLSFAWPRPGRAPYVFDMATAAMAKGEVQIAARDGHSVPAGTGLDADGNLTTDPNGILNGGVLLPFGGYKGSAIATMVELFAGGMTGEWFSYEAAANDKPDGAPPRGGEFMMAISPAIVAGPNWAEHTDGFWERLIGIEGLRLPGDRRHNNRGNAGPREINAALVDKIRDLL